MSIKGFNVGGVVQRYDYTALDNLPQGQGVSDDLKAALLQLAQRIAYIDDQGQTYYQDLYDALYPPRSLNSIDAVFNQGSAVIYDTASLNSLKQYLTVTANYSDGTREMLSDSAYTLSGTLTVGTSTVTASYQGKTDAFDVTVTEAPVLSSISAVYTQSGTVYDTDTLDSLKDDLVVTATYSDSSTQTVPAADYTLSGALTVGTSTITVSYGGKTATFSVTVSEEPIPSEYQRVEYISNENGSATVPWVGTDVRLSGVGDVVIELSFMSTNAESANPYILATRTTNSGNTTGLAIGCRDSYAAVGVYAGGSAEGWVNITPATALNTIISVTAVITSGGVSITDGTNSNSATLETLVHNVTPIYLFGYKKYNVSQNANSYHGRIYSLRITENDAVVMNLVPCVRIADNAAGFYNKATQAFFTGTGATALVAGPVVGE